MKEAILNKTHSKMTKVLKKEIQKDLNDEKDKMAKFVSKKKSEKSHEKMETEMQKKIKSVVNKTLTLKPKSHYDQFVTPKKDSTYSDSDLS